MDPVHLECEHHHKPDSHGRESEQGCRQDVERGCGDGKDPRDTRSWSRWPMASSGSFLRRDIPGTTTLPPSPLWQPMLLRCRLFWPVWDIAVRVTVRARPGHAWAAGAAHGRAFQRVLRQRKAVRLVFVLVHPGLVVPLVLGPLRGKAMTARLPAASLPVATRQAMRVRKPRRWVSHVVAQRCAARAPSSRVEVEAVAGLITPVKRPLPLNSVEHHQTALNIIKHH